MLEALSFVFGGIFRLLPKAAELYDKQKEREHERAMLTLQMQLDEKRAQLDMQKAELNANLQQQVEELRAIIEATRAQAQSSGISIVDALSGLVRPVLTYWYCVAAYGAYKVASFHLILQSGATWQNAITLLWTPNDHAVMFSIIGFWFVDRAIRKREGP